MLFEHGRSKSWFEHLSLQLHVKRLWETLCELISFCQIVSNCCLVLIWKEIQWQELIIQAFAFSAGGERIQQWVVGYGTIEMGGYTCDNFEDVNAGSKQLHRNCQPVGLGKSRMSSKINCSKSGWNLYVYQETNQNCGFAKEDLSEVSLPVLVMLQGCIPRPQRSPQFCLLLYM